MAEIGRWNGIKFEVRSGYIMGFTDLTIKGSVKTEDMESNGVQFVSNKARNPTESTLTVHLDARTGCDVRAVALQLVEMASSGAEDYFYIANKKLVSCKMKLVDANVNKISMNNQGDWICCDVKLTMKQSSLADGSTSGRPVNGSSGGGGGGGGGYTGGTAASSGGGGQKESVKTSSTTTAKKAASAVTASGAVGAAVGKAAAAVGLAAMGAANVAKNVASAVSKAQQTISALISAAKKTTQTKKTTTVGGGGGAKKNAITCVTLK